MLMLLSRLYLFCPSPSSQRLMPFFWRDKFIFLSSFDSSLMARWRLMPCRLLLMLRLLIFRFIA